MAQMTSGVTMLVHLATDATVEAKTTPFGRAMVSLGTNNGVSLTVFMDEHQVRRTAATLIDWLHAQDLERDATELEARNGMF
jgi:hypothetical protein